MNNKTKFKLLFTTFLLSLLTAFFTPVFAAELSKNSNSESAKETINFYSEEGLKILQNSQAKNDFFQLVNFYQPQKNPVFCAVASSTILLNAINYGEISSQKSGEIIDPKSGKKIEFKLFSQDDFFNAKSEKIKKRSVVEFREEVNGNFDAGYSLKELAEILKKAHNLKVKTTQIENFNQETLSNFRQQLQEILSEKSQFILANFDGKILNKKTRGHISPIVAYDSNSDMALVLDVALHKNGWYWVKTSEILRAMNSKDGDNFRGYLVIEKGN